MGKSSNIQRLYRRVAASQVARAVLIVSLSVFLVFGFAPIESHKAAADEASVNKAEREMHEAESALDDAEATQESIEAEHEALTREIIDLQARIDETAKEALEVQQEVMKGRETLAKAAACEYRGSTLQSLVMLVLEAESFNELAHNLVYLTSVMEYQADEIKAQNERSERLDALMKDLNAQKDEQDKKLAELKEKQAQIEAEVAAAANRLDAAQGVYAAAREELEQKIAAAEAQGSASGGPVAVDKSNTNAARPGDQITDVTPGGDSQAGWSTGIASAYGGSTDPSTPNPGITATGAVCNDWSMGVAVPMAWPRYWQYYGRTIEISYGGMTVLATVNDCGYMGGGSRSLDLQPGVWKAFGFSSCRDWGLRTVSYRFL